MLQKPSSSTACCPLDSLWRSSRHFRISSTSKIDGTKESDFDASSNWTFLIANFTFLARQLQLNSVNNMAWRVKPDEVLIEVGKLFGSKIGLQKLNYEVRDRQKGFDSDFKRLFSVQNFSLTQFGVNSGRGSIISCGSVPQPQGVTTIGVFKGERVAIKKISKKKVRNFGSRRDFPEKLFISDLESHANLMNFCLFRSMPLLPNRPLKHPESNINAFQQCRSKISLNTLRGFRK